MGYLLLTTGMRASELLSLKFNDIIQHPIASIEIKGKRGKWRKVLLSSKTIDLINRLNYLLSIEQVNSSFICFSLNNHDKSISYESLRLITLSAIKQITTEKSSPHWFRRAFITKLLAGGSSLYDVMKLSGHESISTTNSYIQDIDNINRIIIPFE